MIGASSIGEFGHVWRDERGAWIFERVLATGSLVLKEIGGDRAGEVACNRFLKAPEVTWEEIAETISEETAQRCAGRRIVVPQDTTDINLRGRDAGRGRRARSSGRWSRAAGRRVHGIVQDAHTLAALLVSRPGR